MTPDEALDREMGYTDWQASCKAPRDDQKRTCRRLCTHTGDHASGFGARRVTWANTGDPRPEWTVVPVAVNP